MIAVVHLHYFLLSYHICKIKSLCLWRFSVIKFKDLKDSCSVAAVLAWNSWGCLISHSEGFFTSNWGWGVTRILNSVLNSVNSSGHWHFADHWNHLEVIVLPGHHVCRSDYMSQCGNGWTAKGEVIVEFWTSCQKFL